MVVSEPINPMVAAPVLIPVPSEEWMQRQYRLPSRHQSFVLFLSLFIFGEPLLVQFVNCPLGINGCQHTVPGMLLVGNRRTPERHHAITHIFVLEFHSASSPYPQSSPVQIHRCQLFRCDLVEIFFALDFIQIVFADVLFRGLLG